MKRLSRGTAALVCLLAALGAEGPVPQWQRYLQGDAAQQAAGLQKQLARLKEAGQFGEALEAAESLAELRGKVQGPDHWQAVDARFEAEVLRRLRRQGEAGQKEHARALLLQRQADALVRQGRYREAQSALEDVLAIRRRLLGEEHPDTARAHNNLAFLLNAQGKYARAEEGLSRALAIWRKGLGEDHPDTAQSYGNLALNRLAQGKHAEAEEGARRALDICRRVLGEEHAQTAQSYNNLALCRKAQGKYAQAEEDYQKALDLQRKLLGEEHGQTATSYQNLATVHNILGKYRQAEEGYRTALAVRRKVLGEEHPDTAKSYNSLAANQQDQGQYAQAEEGYRTALAICLKVLGEDHPQTATCYNNLATGLNAQGKYAEAEEGFRRALAIRREVFGEEHPDTAVAYGNLAANQQSQGKYALAEAGYQKALDILRKALGEEHPGTALGYHNLAHNRQAQGKYALAEEGFRKALAIWRKALGERHPHTALSHTSLAANLLQQGKIHEAEQGYQKALEIRLAVFGEEHPDTALAYNNLAYCQDSLGKAHEAEQSYRKALALFRRVLGEDHPHTAGAYHNLAANQNQQGKYAQAEALWRSAAQSFARARLHSAAGGLDRAAFSSLRSPLPALAAVLARNGKPDEAWQAFEESLSRGTWDDLSARLRLPAQERSRQAELTARIERLTQRLEQSGPEAARQRDELLHQLRQAYDGQAALGRRLEERPGPGAGQVFPLRRIQAALPADTALLGWLDLSGHAWPSGGEHWAVLLRSSGQPVWVRLQGSGAEAVWTDADTQLPARLRDALQGGRGDWQPLAQRLRRQRMQPLAPHLDGVRRLIVLPASALAGVPVQVIAEGATVSYAPSGTLYAHLRRQPPSRGKGLFALADPVFDAPAAQDSSRGDWQRLPGTRTEVAALQHLFGDEEPSRVVLDSDASEQRLQEQAGKGELAHYRYLHLATHGEVDDAFPLRSALILARDRLPDERQRLRLLQSGEPIPDGRLTAEEVLTHWRLDCELVTLSACQTALGKYERGEGFVGFAQALLLAGSRSVCLSLWKVDDAATALLMQRFYENLLGKREGLKGPLPRAEALAEAKRWLRGLSREEALRRAAQLSAGTPRGKGRKVQPLRVDAAPAEAPRDDRPFAHPYYWAAFVLMGRDE